MRDMHNTLHHEWLDAKGANSIWTCCCWQLPPPLHSRADGINGSHWQNCVRRMSERSYAVWKHGDVSKSSSDTRRLAQMNKNILEWVTAYNGKSDQCNLHCSQRASDITEDYRVYFLCFLHLFSRRTRASKQRVFMSVSSSECRGCSENWGRSRQWTWKGSPVSGADLRDDKWPQQHMNIWRLPSYLQKLRMLLWPWRSEASEKFLCWVNLTFVLLTEYPASGKASKRLLTAFQQCMLSSLDYARFNSTGRKQDPAREGRLHLIVVLETYFRGYNLAVMKHW